MMFLVQMITYRQIIVILVLGTQIVYNSFNRINKFTIVKSSVGLWPFTLVLKQDTVFPAKPFKQRRHVTKYMIFREIQPLFDSTSLPL